MLPNRWKAKFFPMDYTTEPERVRFTLDGFSAAGAPRGADDKPADRGGRRPRRRAGAAPAPRPPRRRGEHLGDHPALLRRLHALSRQAAVNIVTR